MANIPIIGEMLERNIYPKKDDTYSYRIIHSETNCSDDVDGFDTQLKTKTTIIEQGIKDINNLTNPEIISEYMSEYLKKNMYVIFNSILAPLSLKLNRERIITILFEEFKSKNFKSQRYIDYLEEIKNDGIIEFTNASYLKKMELMDLNESDLDDKKKEYLITRISIGLNQISNDEKKKNFALKLENYEIELEKYSQQKLDDTDFSGPEPIEPKFDSKEEDEEKDVDEEDELWRDVTATSEAEIIKPANIDDYIPLSIDYYIPLKKKYIIKPVELLNNLTNLPTSRELSRREKMLLNQQIQHLNQTCINHKQSFYTPNNKNLKLDGRGRLNYSKIDIDLNKLDSNNRYQIHAECCYKDLYLLENGKKIIDVKLNQIKQIEKYTNDKIKSDIEKFDREKINTDSLLLDELRARLEKCPFLAEDSIFKSFLDRSFIKFNEIISLLDEIKKIPLKNNLKNLLTKHLIELSVIAERYSLLNTFNTYQLIENETNTCKSRTNTSLRHQLHLFVIKKKFQNYIQSFKTEVAKKKRTIMEWATTATTMAEHANEFIDAISSMKFCVPELKIGVNINEDDVRDFIRRSKNLNRVSNRIQRGLDEIIEKELDELKNLEDDELFFELNGEESLLDITKWKEKLEKLVENPTLETVTQILTTFCVPDMLINDNVPLEIFLNELLDVIIDFMNSSMNYFTEKFASNNSFINKFGKLARDLIPGFNLGSIAFSEDLSNLHTSFNIFSVATFTFDTANTLGGFTGLSALIELIMKLIIRFIIATISDTKGRTDSLSVIFSSLLSSFSESVRDVVVRRMKNTYDIILSLSKDKFIYNTLNRVNSNLQKVYKTINTDPEILTIQNMSSLTTFGIQQLEIKYIMYINTQENLRPLLINSLIGVGITAFLQQKHTRVASNMIGKIYPLLNAIKDIKKKDNTPLTIDDLIKEIPSNEFDNLCSLIRELTKEEKNITILSSVSKMCDLKKGAYNTVSAFARWIPIINTTRPIVAAELIVETIPNDNRMRFLASSFDAVATSVAKIPGLGKIIKSINHISEGYNLYGGTKIKRTRKIKKIKNKRMRKTKSIK
jgi:hypothetical protein